MIGARSPPFSPLPSSPPPDPPRSRCGHQCKTERGLKIGDSLDRVRELYPELQRFSDLYGQGVGRYEWALVLEVSPVGGPPNLLDSDHPRPQGRLAQGLTVRRGD